MARRQSNPQGTLVGDLPRRLLAWYDRHGRDLPWRAKSGRRSDPYRVWLSEIMLQQTMVATVGPYYLDFLKRWPTVHDLAAAGLDEVLHAWQGLGYYARARNLHRCAQAVSRNHGGRFPGTEPDLRQLPGIGPYTAAAVAAIAFDRPATTMDGNVERVMARLFGVATPLPKAKPELFRRARSLTPSARPADYAQAIMDLGATVCLPRNPRCQSCPWSSGCLARQRGTQDKLPARLPKPVRPMRYGVVFWTTRSDGAVLLRRRPERGLLGGLMELPSTEWRDRPWRAGEGLAAAPVAADWRALDGVVRHGFTHFELSLSLVVGRTKGRGAKPGIWCPVDRLSDHALPTLMKKVVRHVLANP
ncbi:MAG: A/G-specific adenine glycosylase [Dongiaceae bacterium]